MHTFLLRWLYTESERQRLTALLAERDNDLSAKEYKIRQARRLVEDERRARLAAEADREAFARQVLPFSTSLTLTSAFLPRLPHFTAQQSEGHDPARRGQAVRQRDPGARPAHRHHRASLALEVQPHAGVRKGDGARGRVGALFIQTISATSVRLTFLSFILADGVDPRRVRLQFRRDRRLARRVAQARECDGKQEAVFTQVRAGWPSNL